MVSSEYYSRWFLRVALCAVVLAYIVIILGAYVRLSNAGLGCPDWPGCYGQLIVPDAVMVDNTEASFAARPLESAKAWKEMIHRYAASALGLLVLTLFALAWRMRDIPRQQFWLPAALLVIVCFQGALGMWTVTLLLKPVIVTLHLLMGMLTISLLWMCVLRQRNREILFLESRCPRIKDFRPWAKLALVMVILQIALGGWTSTNYAAIHCPELPTCQGEWWPETDFEEAFTILRPSGVDYEGGVLSNKAAVTVHLSHRIGAILTFIIVGGFALFALLRIKQREVRRLSALLALVLIAQVGLGLGNILLHLPISIAVAHNAGAALLLLILMTMNYLLIKR